MSEDRTSFGALTDVDWVNRSFILALGRAADKKEDSMWRTYSDTDLMYTGTGLGENTILNSVAQFTPLADIPRRGVWARDTGAIPKPKTKNGKGLLHVDKLFGGLGRAYGETHRKNQQTVHLRFGTVVYKGMVTFLTGFYDNESAVVAKYGRAPITYFLGKAVGTILTLPLAPFILAASAWNMFIGRTSSRFCDLKPNMSNFYTRANVIYNSLGANMGIIARTSNQEGHYNASQADSNVDNMAVAGAAGGAAAGGAAGAVAGGAAGAAAGAVVGPSYETGGDNLDDLDPASKDAYQSYMSLLMPKVFKSDGRIDFFEVALGGARRENLHKERIDAIGESASNLADVRKRILQMIQTPDLATPKSIGIEAYLAKYTAAGMYGDSEDLKRETDDVEDEVNNAIKAVAEGTDPQALDKLAAVGQTQTDANAAASAAQGGSGEVTAEGAQQTSTEGSTTEQTPPPTAPQATKGKQEFKTVAKALDGGKEYIQEQGWFPAFGENFGLEAKQGAAFLNLGVNYTGSSTISFSNSLKDMSISGVMNGMAGGARDTRVSMSDYNTGFGFVDAALGMVRNVFAGVLDGVSMSGLMALAGNAFIDFPKQWDDSSVTLPTASFTIELRSPYGNDLGHYLNVYPVIAALLAAALPPSAGPKAYTSPFVCECYSQGLCAIRLGMITDLSITAGVGNLGYNEHRRPLGFDISFTVADLSSIMHAPINNGFNVLKPWRRILDDDSIFSDYLSTISGVSVRDMTDPRRKLAIRMAARMADYKAWISPSHMASVMADNGVVRTLNKLFSNSAYPGL